MRGFIYKLTSAQTDKIYIGSTTQTLELRFIKHKCPANRCSSSVLMVHSDVKIELVEEIEFEDKLDLYEKEDEYIKEFAHICVNLRGAILDLEKKKAYQNEWNKQFYAENQESQKQRSAEYREANPEKVKESFKKWYDSHEEYNKERNKLAWEKNKNDEEFREANRQRIREWHEANKEKVKKYRQDNKDRANEKRRALINCPTCGKEISKASLSRHNKLLHK